MGALGGILGLNGGFNGTGAAAPTGTTINPGVNNGQLATAYQGTQGGLNNQQQLLQALQAQNGIGNQNNVFNQQQALANQYGNIANGQGPNPAQAMLAQQTGNNIAATNALMAGKRGASANPALMAALAANQGAATQQQAVGQGATMQANQSLGALGQQGAQLANMGQTSGQQVQNQIAATGAGTEAQLAQQQQLLAANQAANNANVSMQSNINNANAGLAESTMPLQQGVLGGAIGGLGAGLVPGGSLGSALGAAGKGISAAGATGGIVGYADGGAVQQPMQQPIIMMPPTHQRGTTMGSSLLDYMHGIAPVSAYAEGGLADNMDQRVNQRMQERQQMQMPQPVPSRGPVDPGILLPDKRLNGVTHPKVINASNGALVNGTAPVPGNSYENDKVEALLSPGELVVDRETMADGGKAGEAARFLAAVIAAKKRGEQ